MIRILFLASIVLFSICSCGKGEKGNSGPQRFQLLDPTTCGISFQNNITEDYRLNVFNYEYLYNGGGVAIGDINDDGLADVYFTSTTGSNKLYINKGDLKFEDITDRAGVAASAGFKTGVTMADVNGDGWLDIYVCRTSRQDDGMKANLLYINNHNNTFTEKAVEYNLAGNSNTNHAAFFDYDLDGDLDMFMMNHRVSFDEATKMRLQQRPDGSIYRQTFPLSQFESCKLMRNDGQSFVDITEQAGLTTSAYSLSATVADINMDNYPDIYLGNDYIEPDAIFINNNGVKFEDKAGKMLGHMAQNSMGSDVADFNNDGLPDIISLDMIAEDPFRYKQLMNIMQFERYQSLLKYGYGHQASRNMLQLNNGNNTFSEIGQLAGISNTDWSWSASMVDFDNDGFKDIYISNGYRKDVTDNDYMVYTRDSIERLGGIVPAKVPDINSFLKIIPELKIPNYMFRNKGNLQFENLSAAWGMDKPSFSNGYATADLDKDGDMDLIVNNINDLAFVYENRTTQIGGSHYLQVTLDGPMKNKMGMGTKVWIYTGDSLQYQEMYTNRGFLSSSEALLHFGLAGNAKVDRVEIRWPDGKSQILTNVKADQRIKVRYSDAGSAALTPLSQLAYNYFVPQENLASSSTAMKEDDFIDFNTERLLPSTYAKQGPKIAVGDVNGDGLDDYYQGAPKLQTGQLWLQNTSGKFQLGNNSAFKNDIDCEDGPCSLSDLDGDKDLDLVVCSTGNQDPQEDKAYRVRTYLNDGKGNFTFNTKFPDIKSSAGALLIADIDNDGKPEIIIGGRISPGHYPEVPRSFILSMSGDSWADKTDALCPQFLKCGMITDLAVADLNADKQLELIATGEWMPIKIFSKNGASFVDQTQSFGMANTNGWWRTLLVQDVDGDGDIDITGGNLGLNTRLKASVDAPLELFAADFDGNGSTDPILAFHDKGKLKPLLQRDVLAKQLPMIKKTYPRYRGYSSTTMEELLGDKLKNTQNFKAYQFSTTLFINEKGKFKAVDLPLEVQQSPIGCILSIDVNKDGKMDMILAGNDLGAETETGVYDACTGVLLLNLGGGKFKYVRSKESGLWIQGEARDMAIINIKGKQQVICSRNGETTIFHEIK